jgi:hypothetical protein
MAEDNLFDKVKNAIRGQKSSFCSRSTSVTPLGTIDPTESIQYTNCQGETTEIPYGDITITGGYIPDCVQGGSPISVKKIPVKLFIQYGTTDCDTPPPPPPGSNLIIMPCDKQTPIVVSRGSISTTLTKGDICYITFKDNMVTNRCYEIGDVTNDPSVDTIEGEPQSFGPGNCSDCVDAINLTITDCDKGTTYIVDTSNSSTQLTNGGVYFLSFEVEGIPSGCYTIGNRTPSQKVENIANIVPFNDCPSCLNPPA